MKPRVPRPTPSEDALPDSILLPSGPFPITWRRSTRARRLSLRLSRAGDSVVVTLPPRVSPQTGLALLNAHRDWIVRQLQRQPVAISFAAGNIIPINGVAHTIHHTPEGRGGAWIDTDHKLHVSGDAAFLGRRVRDFLLALAQKRLGQRLQELAGRSGFAPKTFALRDATSRWGSCSTAGRIMLNWRLIMAPHFVQDYVILHELAHMKHHNHSAAFWTLVDQMCPTRNEAELWLKNHGLSLMRAG
ncbi:M48 family metallopeptidase [Acetobacter sp. UBA5411]|uniref:M48 family metallopeptidase n=1 Tax=Acetobacter sp. UBA5411 TaxID=1945905 RepID=UPI0025C003A4|nr:SprT family zinc-dependent metalloprotease [Acetobacter sp. UBA5411]